MIVPERAGGRVIHQKENPLVYLYLFCLVSFEFD